MVYYCITCDKFLRNKKKREKCEQRGHRTIAISLRGGRQTIVIRDFKYYYHMTSYLEINVLRDLVNSNLIRKPKIYQSKRNLHYTIYFLSEDEYQLYRSRYNIIYKLSIINEFGSRIYNLNYEDQAAVDSKVAAKYFLENLEKVVSSILEKIAEDSFGAEVIRMLRENCKKRNIIPDILYKIASK